MPKYIDADAFEESARQRYCKPCREVKNDWHGVACRACWVDDMLDEVDNAPAADVEPVIRCRDCKFKPTAPDGITHGFQVEFPDEEHNPCPCQCEDGWYSWMPPDDFFCAHGAKMDEEVKI